MEQQEIKTIKTTKGVLRYFQDWDNWDGGVRMLNAKTTKRYKELQNTHPDADKYGVFFAFSKEQFANGVAHLKELGFIKDESELRHDKSTGAIGTSKGLDGYFNFYKESRASIPTECDPQEVYFYEWNNYESMYAGDGDTEAIKVIIRYWGVDVAKKIKCLHACYSISQILKKKL